MCVHCAGSSGSLVSPAPSSTALSTELNTVYSCHTHPRVLSSNSSVTEATWRAMEGEVSCVAIPQLRLCTADSEPSSSARVGMVRLPLPEDNNMIHVLLAMLVKAFGCLQCVLYGTVRDYMLCLIYSLCSGIIWYHRGPNLPHIQFYAILPPSRVFVANLTSDMPIMRREKPVSYGPHTSKEKERVAIERS